MRATALFLKSIANLFKNKSYVNVYSDGVLVCSRDVTKYIGYLGEACAQIKENKLKFGRAVVNW